MTSKKCAALYQHTNIRNGDRIYPCCRFKKQLMDFDGDVDNILHSKEYVELRKRFENNEQIPECQKCWDQEKAGIKSTRQYFNDQYDCDEIKLKYLWIGLDNNCNLKCEPCGAEWSNQFNGKTIYTKTLDNIPELERIVFVGGEPLMNQRYFRLLKNIKKDNLHLAIITNGMFKLKEEWKDLLRKCKYVKFFVSIDAFSKLNDEVRSGSKWDTIVETVQDLESEWPVTINTVIHKKNVQGIEDLKRWVDKRPWEINILTYPEHLRITPDDEQRIIRDFNQYFSYKI